MYFQSIIFEVSYAVFVKQQFKNIYIVNVYFSLIGFVLVILSEKVSHIESLLKRKSAIILF